MTAAEQAALLEDLRAMLSRIHPDVLSATCEELDAAGWGNVPREKIPVNWRELDAEERKRIARRAKAARYRANHGDHIRERERRKYGQRKNAAN